MQPFQRAKSWTRSLKHISTRRTSGHCLGTFKTGGKNITCPSSLNVLNVSRYFALSLSLFKGLRELKIRRWKQKTRRMVSVVKEVRLKERFRGQEGEEGDVCSCWMTLRKKEDTGS
jgi:hypothetical protein